MKYLLFVVTLGISLNTFAKPVEGQGCTTHGMQGHWEKHGDFWRCKPTPTSIPTKNDITIKSDTTTKSDLIKH